MPQRPIAEIVRDLNAHFERTGETQDSLAERVKRDQGTVSRALGGSAKRLSKTMRDLCEYAEVPIDTEPARNKQTALPDVLVHAIQQVWNGQSEHAEALARILQGIAAAQEAAVAALPPK